MKRILILLLLLCLGLAACSAADAPAQQTEAYTLPALLGPETKDAGSPTEPGAPEPTRGPDLPAPDGGSDMLPPIPVSSEPTQPGGTPDPQPAQPGKEDSGSPAPAASEPPGESAAAPPRESTPAPGPSDPHKEDPAPSDSDKTPAEPSQPDPGSIPIQPGSGSVPVQPSPAPGKEEAEPGKEEAEPGKEEAEPGQDGSGGMIHVSPTDQDPADPDTVTIHSERKPTQVTHMERWERFVANTTGTNPQPDRVTLHLFTDGGEPYDLNLSFDGNIYRLDDSISIGASWSSLSVGREDHPRAAKGCSRAAHYLLSNDPDMSWETYQASLASGSSQMLDSVFFLFSVYEK